MLENGRGLIKALENWAKRVTVGYKDVNVRDLSTSFRDGLAFCAIIHFYRPDLIDFDSLSRENIFENNNLAFSVAEKQLGVPALLDADDMVKYARPDRLSIITYLSQLRNCFENQNKVNKKVDLKRIQKNSIGPPAKVPGLEPSFKRHEVCHVCKHRVFILERLMVDGKLYHTACFRCNKCNNLLNPGAYVESDTLGMYECSVCLVDDETSENTESSMETPEQSEDYKVNDLALIRVSKPEVKPEKEFASKEAVSFAKSNLAEANSKFEKSPILRSYKHRTRSEEAKKEEKAASEVKVSVKDKINVFEKNQVNEKPSSPISPSVVVTPVPKPRHSTISHNNAAEYSPSISNRFSLRQSLVSPKSPEKCDRETEKERFSPKNLFAKDLLPKTELSSEEKNSSKKFVKDLNGDIPDSLTNSNTSLNKVPDVNSTLSNDIRNLDSEKSIPSVRSGYEFKYYSKEPYVKENDDAHNSVTDSSPNKVSDVNIDTSSSEIRNSNSENSMFSIRSGSESPKSSRDIFKSSLQPLKLSLLSPGRKEPFSSSVAQSESKTFDIPQIKSSYSLSGIRRLRNSSESHSEVNLNSSADVPKEDKITRRSSLESSSEAGSNESRNKSSLGTSSNTFHRVNSSHELGCHADTDVTKTSPKSYSPIYKRLYGSSALTSSSVSDILNRANLSKSAISSEAKQDEEKDLNQSLNSSVDQSLSSKISLRDETSSAEKKKDLEAPPVPHVSYEESIESKDEKEYPDDLNPFGDEEEEENKNEEYPDDLNPFGDDDEVMNTSKVSVVDYDESKNPFASDEEEEESKDNSTSTYSPKPSSQIETKSPYYPDSSISSTLSSPSGSLKGTLKKRPAPRPPKVTDIFPKDAADSGADSSLSSTKASPSLSKRNVQASSPKLRKNKPAPPPPTPPTPSSASPSVQDPTASVKMTKETDNMKLKSSTAEDKQTPKQQFKKKKRPAPPVPIPVRRDMKKIPLREIMQEMKEIEEKQREYERQGREIELLIRDRDKDEEPSVEEEEYIMQLFELVNQKNALFRRQAELMYIKRSQRLEEQQHQIEKEIRQLMEKPESEKTEEDKQKEEDLTLELIDIVDQRNSIIDSIERDRRRELEEDHSVQEQLEIKNGDLPITAEIKQKTGKNKKNKKKEKKKQQAEEESGKGGTLKKKKNLFSKRS